MFYVTIAGLTRVLDKVVEYLGLPEVVEEGRTCLKAYLEEKYGGWKEIVRKGVEWGIEAALSALKAVKEEIVKVCCEYEPLIVQLTKLGVKSTARIATEVGVKTLTKNAVRSVTKTATNSAVKEATKVATKTTVKGAVKTATKSTAKGTTKAATKGAVKGASADTSKALFKAANPVGVVADVAQAGLELVGQEEAGRAVGIGGNMVSGAMMGGAVGGPPGAAIGAGLGFALWATGEVAGGVTGRFIDWLSGPS